MWRGFQNQAFVPCMEGAMPKISEKEFSSKRKGASLSLSDLRMLSRHLITSKIDEDCRTSLKSVSELKAMNILYLVIV